jgi:hypothetical protein
MRTEDVVDQPNIHLHPLLWYYISQRNDGFSLKSKMPQIMIKHFFVKCAILDREGSLEVGKEGDR